ncbi:YybS family protein [Sporolactobacillus sp. THM19-2]|uniref:YybS family protein n=1 Tax=Sporolactobacillus sp. THM19-2 TaxID=2511171 RepID=UPI00102275F5|nr:YybS family protein [Sporolactobacillus sp. THM19-2]RYL94157.1 DUF2232 domain-containing protein [Sporolactobacillus sp. THM19-2]
MKNKNALFHGLLTLLFLSLLLIVTVYVPAVSLLTIWLIPVPLMYLTAKFSWPYGLAGFIAAAAVLLIILPGPGAVIPNFFMIIGCVMGEIIHRKKPAFAVLLGGSLASIAVLILYLAFSVLVMKFNPITAFKDIASQSIELSLNQFGSLLNQDKGKLLEFYRNQLDYLGYLAPSLLVMIGVFYSLIVELIALPLLRLLKVDVPGWIPFRTWQVPRSLIWLYLFVLVIQLFVPAESGTSFYTALINIEFVFQILLAIQGLSFIFYFMYVKKVPIAVPILITVVVLIFSFPLLQLVWILGIIDLGFNLRKRIRGKQ